MALRILVNYGRDKELRPGSQNQAMGGIRTAALGLTAALARRGHEIHLFAPCPNPGPHEGVTFHDRSELAAFSLAETVDILVAIPDVLPLLMPIRARARVVWTGNAFETGDPALTVPFAWAPEIGKQGRVVRLYCMNVLHPYADRIVVGSRWQAEHLRCHAGIPAEKFSILYLGVSLHHFQARQPHRHRHRLIYTSQARRGLDVLLRLFPGIRAAVPDAELHVFGYEYGNANTVPDLPGAHQPGIHWRGKVGKQELARELQAAAVMVYPSTFRETFCLSVAEAQAAGLPVVASDRAALPERIESGVDGFLIKGRPTKAANETAFVEAAVRLLRDEQLWARMGGEAAAKARKLYDWNHVAAAWEDMLEQLIVGKAPSLPPPLSVNPSEADGLTVKARGVSMGVTYELAAQWLRESWASYGYEMASVPRV